MSMTFASFLWLPFFIGAAIIFCHLHLSFRAGLCFVLCYVRRVKCCNLYKITFDQHGSVLGYPRTCKDNVTVLPVCGSHGP